MVSKLAANATCDSSNQMRLLGVLALIAAFAFGSVAFGPMLAADCMFVGIVEECIFTGAVFSLISKYYAASVQEAYKTSQQARAEIKPAAITALLFALCHLAMPWKLPIAFAFSLCMIWLYRRSGSIMWTICAHAVFDMLWFGLFALS